jgi:hypothetical protein
MRKVLLGVVLSAAFGLSTNGAGATTASVNHAGKRLACHWVATGDHTLKLLRATLEPVKTADRPVRYVSTTVAPASKSAREPAARARPVISRAELGHFERQLVQRISLMVGVGY